MNFPQKISHSFLAYFCFMKKWFGLFLNCLCGCILLNHNIHASDTLSPPLIKKRLTIIVGSEILLHGGSTIYLNELWYKNYPRSTFHFFNDNAEWLQMDKAGHFITSYYIGKIGIDLLKWSGLSHRKAVWYGGLLGSVYQLTIEGLDAFSTQWGFSTGDVLANTMGSGLLIAQELNWREQRACLKYSFRKSPYASYRPDALGKSLYEQIIKDYNGQTYWLSVNIASFLRNDIRFPRWLNIAVGYGADGMTGARNNNIPAEAQSIPRNRQFYLSLDADLNRLKIKHPLLKVLIGSIGFLKVPFPALCYSGKRMKINALGF